MLRDKDDGMAFFLQSESVFDAVQDLGFDSMSERFEDANNLIVFKPTQIKSAIGNTGAYDATNPDIRYSLKNTAFHSGDLGYGKDTVLGRMSGRSTGHFGTGTYFTSTEPEESRFNPRKDRPKNIVNLNGYKLARPRTKDNARILHKGLNQVNDLSSYLNGVKKIDDDISSRSRNNTRAYGRSGNFYKISLASDKKDI
jgi:hypothetical protein